MPLTARFACVVIGVAAASATAASLAAGGQTWNPKLAATYLDGRAGWWTTWPTAKRDHGTFCVSCHTTVPYILARPALRSSLGEQGPSAAEKRLLENVTSRVTRWNEMEPFYPDQTRGIPKTSESRGTEAVLDALTLAVADRETGRLSPATRLAFEHLWALQMKTGPLSGAWAWLDFHNEPWEAPNSPYLGATLAAIALGSAPEAYASAPEIAGNVKALGAYLDREFDQQPLFNRLMLAWASARVPALVGAERRQAIVDATIAAELEDGGWSLANLGTWSRADGTPLERGSDGCATGLATFALEQVHAAPDAVARGIAWLRAHQDTGTGRWWAASLNKQRDPASDAGQFMSDAATAFAVLALAGGR